MGMVCGGEATVLIEPIEQGLTHLSASPQITQAAFNRVFHYLTDNQVPGTQNFCFETIRIEQTFLML